MIQKNFMENWSCVRSKKYESAAEIEGNENPNKVKLVSVWYFVVPVNISLGHVDGKPSVQMTDLSK